MEPSRRESFFRRLGRALKGANEAKLGHPVTPPDLEPGTRPAPALTVDDPPKPR